MLSTAAVSQANLKSVASAENPLYAAREPGAAEPRLWTYYHKPIFVMVIGGLVLCAGAVFVLLSANEIGDVPQAMGPVCLSIGLMFVVVALVWLPIIKDKLKRKGPKSYDSCDVE